MNITFFETELVLSARLEVIQRHEELRVILLVVRQQVLFWRPSDNIHNVNSFTNILWRDVKLVHHKCFGDNRKATRLHYEFVCVCHILYETQTLTS